MEASDQVTRNTGFCCLQPEVLLDMTGFSWLKISLYTKGIVVSLLESALKLREMPLRDPQNLHFPGNM